jgi:integrase
MGQRVLAAKPPCHRGPPMWHKALRWNLAAENPFKGVKAGQQVNEARKFFVNRETIEQVIAKAPDTEWAAIIALARYGGIPELFALRWADIDFDSGRMIVHSPKTEHHAGGASRLVPLFIELRPYLEKLFNESAAEGAVYVVSKHRLAGTNLRTEFQRMIADADLMPWPKLFHNLRASR